LVSAIRNAGSHASTAPIYGTMFSSPETIPVRMGNSIPSAQKNRLLAAITSRVTTVMPAR
jgi:hypothetical protein